MNLFNNIHFKRINVYIFESLLPRFGAFLFLPLLLRFVNPAIWAEIVLMIAVSEILSKIYLFGFQSSIFRFAKELDDNQKNFIIFKLLMRVLFSGILFLVLFEITNPYFWNNVFEFEFGLPLRSAIFISCFSSVNLFFIQYIKSLQLSRKLFTGSLLYTLTNLFLQFSSIFYISTNFGKSDRMIVTAYLASLGIACLVRTIYYLRILNVRLVRQRLGINLSKFYNFARPAAGIAFIAIAVSHGSKLIIQSSIDLDTIGKYFSYLSYASIVFVLFAATQEYFSPTLYNIDTKKSIRFRVSTLYFWTFATLIYLLILNKLSFLLIPNNYNISTTVYLLIFHVQIGSILRSIVGIYYEINELLKQKFILILISSIIFLLSLSSIGDIESYLRIFLIFYILLGNSLILYSREYKLVLHFNFLHALIYFIFNTTNLLATNWIVIIFMTVLLIAFGVKILNNYQNLRSFT